MSKIDELITKLCPKGVPYVSFGDIATESTVRNSSRKDLIVHSVSNSKGLIPTSDYFENTRTSDNVSNYKIVSPNSFVYNPARINVGSIARNFSNREIIVSPMYVVFSIFEECVFPGYFEKLLGHHKVQNFIVSSTEQGARFRFPFETFSKLRFQIPPVEIQSEIVQILDTFTELETELEAELEARKKQYEFYRNSLLTFSDIAEGGVQWLALEEVAKIRNGSDHKHLQDGPYPLYGSGGVMRSVEKFSYSKPSVLIPRKGSLKNLFYLDQPFWTVDTIFFTEIDESLVHPKFLFHWLKNQELEKLDVAGGVPSLTQSILNRVMIPLPNISTQIEISDKLDAFSTLLESSSTGLPAEIAARRQQYEYYRNKLLTFKELKAS
jgi:type I restriction enzyme S subunit